MENIVHLDEASLSGKGFHEESDVIKKTVYSLVSGHVVAVPTDTIYGIAALAQSTAAVDKIYKIKCRQREKALAICVATIAEVKRWGKVTVSDSLLNDVLPGPVTLVFRRSPSLNPKLNPATDSIGIRIPKCEFIQTLARVCGQPLVLTSANISSAISALKIKEFEELWPQLDLIIDAGTVGNTEQCRLGSTVVDLTITGEYHIIREGCAFHHVTEILEKKHGLKNRDKELP